MRGFYWMDTEFQHLSKKGYDVRWKLRRFGNYGKVFIETTLQIIIIVVKQLRYDEIKIIVV